MLTTVWDELDCCITICCLVQRGKPLVSVNILSFVGKTSQLAKSLKIYHKLLCPLKNTNRLIVFDKPLYLFVCIIEGFLPHNKKCIEVTVVVVYK